MRAQLEAIVDELKQLRDENVEAVYLADETLENLRANISDNLQTQVGENKIVNNSPQKLSNTDVNQLAELNELNLAEKEKSQIAVSSKRREKALEDVELIAKPEYFELPEGDKLTQWNWLRDRVLHCSVCKSHVREGKQIVFGVGDVNSDIFFCGEAPGADEEKQGEPFVGAAGQLLNRIISAMGLKRENVYIGNIMNWRPEKPNMEFGNRPPTQNEMDFCLPYLIAQLKIVSPKIIVALGATAAKGLLGKIGERSMRDLRGNWFDFHKIPLMVTYHPSYLLHNSTLRAKRQVWEDMLKVMDRVSLTISEKQRGYFLK